jgi:hypothetical protein
VNRPVYERDEGASEDRPRRRGRLLGAVVSLLVLAAVVIVVLVLVINGTSSESAKKDVTVTTCRSVDGGKPTASGRILNHSSKTSNYVIRLKFTDAEGNTVSEGLAPVDSVGADRTATWELTGARDVKGSVRCEITGVSRTHVPGQ